MTAIQDFQAVVAEAAAPLKARLTEIEGLLTELRSEKLQIEAVLRKADQLPRKEKPPAKPKGQQVTPAEVASLWGWLKAHENGDGIIAARLWENEEFRSTVTMRSGVLVQALAELHERGNLTLDRIAQGGAKVYKVVA